VDTKVLLRGRDIAQPERGIDWLMRIENDVFVGPRNHLTTHVRLKLPAPYQNAVIVFK